MTNTAVSKICIKGKAYIDSKDEITLKSAYINRHQPFKIKKIENFTLLEDNASAQTAKALKQLILLRLYNYYTKGKSFNGEVLEEHQNIQVGAGTSIIGYNGIASKVTSEYHKITRIEVE